MNQLQEDELLVAFFHYFVWKERQLKAASGALLLASPKTEVLEANETAPAVADQGKSTDDEGNRAKSPEQSLCALNDVATKYRGMADAMLLHFPQHLINCKDKEELQTTMPPIVSTLYIDYPALQAMHGAQPVSDPPQANFEVVVRDESAGQKRKGVRNDRPGASKHMKITTRDDIPTDVKLFINEMCANSNKKMASTKRQIKRLEARVKKAREEKKEIAAKAAKIAEEAAKAAKIADEAAQRLQQLPISESKSAPKTSTAGEISDGKPTAQNKPSSEEKAVKQHCTFEERVEELEHFFKGNGHCRVPVRGTALGRWVSEIRFIYKEVQKGKSSDTLTPERIKKLEEMGFEWDLGRQIFTWEERFEDLKRFKEKFGHCNVPRTTYKDDPSLGEWVHMQRKSRTRSIAL